MRTVPEERRLHNDSPSSRIGVLWFPRGLNVGPIGGYPEVFANDIGVNVRVRYASERGGAESVLETYAIHDLLSGQEIYRAKALPDAPAILHSPCASWHEPGCQYPSVIEIESTQLPAGMYYAVLTDAAGHTSDPIYFCLRPPPGQLRPPSVAVVYPTLSYWAHGEFAGGSLYEPGFLDGHNEVSMLRPIEDYRGSWREYNAPEALARMAAGLREAGIPLLQLTSMDLHEHPEYLQSVRVLLLGPHDEYWTRPMADAVREFLMRGGRVAVLGGGVQTWQVAVRGTAIGLDRRDTNEGRSPWLIETGRFRAPWIDRPPEETFGLSRYFGGWPVGGWDNLPDGDTGFSEDERALRGGIIIEDAAHPIFLGTGLKKGSVYGADEQVFHWRADGIPLTEAKTPDYARAPRAASRLRVLAYAPARTGGRHRPTRLENIGIIAETRHPGGGIVLHFGSYGWFRSISPEDDVGKRILENTVRYLLTAE